MAESSGVAAAGPSVAAASAVSSVGAAPTATGASVVGGALPSPSEVLRPNGEEGRWARVREVWHALVLGFKHNDLLTYASATSFQILTAIIPFLMFVLAVTELLHANSIWLNHVQPQLRVALPPSIFTAVQNSVNVVFRGHPFIWATFGGLLTLWQVSGAVRAVMGALARIYEAPSERPFFKRYSISFVLSIEISLCFILAAICVLFAPFFEVVHTSFLLRALGLLVRWTLVVALLALVVGLLVRHAPARSQKLPWVTLGASIVIVTWILASLLFYVYLVDIASYDSLFGSLASVIVSMAYLYVSTSVFFFGAQLDAIIRAQATGCPVGHVPES